MTHIKLAFHCFFIRNGYFVSHKIDERSFPDANATVDMYLGAKVIGMIINNEYDTQGYKIKCLGIREDNSNLASSKDSYVSKTFWFGGNSTAPHKMQMKFHDLYVDYSGYETKFNSNDIMTWNLSEFNSPDNFNYYASEIINGSVVNRSIVEYASDYPNKEYQKCIIHSGAHITFNSGQEVHLYPGFYAEQGSYFKADIIEIPAVNVKQTPASFAESIEYKTENALSVEFALYYDDTRDSVVYSKQAFITDSLAKIAIDTVLPNQTYYAVADFYSGKGSRKRVEGFVNNDNYGFNISKIISSGKGMFNNITVYPNPSNDIYNIKVSNNVSIISIKVMALSGQEILNKQISENTNSFSFNLYGSQKGIYFLTVITTAGNKTIKLVK